MTQINFGNITKVGNKTVTSGSQSGIDTAGLIDSLVKAKRLPAVSLETRVTDNTSKIDALGELRSKSKAVLDAANSLRNPSGFLNINDNVFESRRSFLTASDGSTASNYLGISVENGATISSYDIQIGNLAVANKKTTNATYAFASRTTSIVEASPGSTVGKLSAGNFTLGLSGGDTAVINVQVGDSLNSVVSSINARKSTTNIEASILQVSSTDFRLVLTSTKTGDVNDITITDTDNVFPVATGTFFDDIPAEDASIKFNGTTIARSTNKIDDIIDGVTFSLFEETGITGADPSLKLEVDKDSSGVLDTINSLVTAYNDFRTFYAKQNERDDNGQYLDTAYLHDSALLRNTANSLFTHLAKSINTGNDDIQTLADIGITFVDIDADTAAGTPAVTNTLQVDTGALATKIESNFDSVKALFGFSFTSSGQDLSLYSTSNTLGNISSFDVAVNTVVTRSDSVPELTINSYTNELGNIDSFDVEVNADTTTVTIKNAKNINGDAIAGTFNMTYTDTAGVITLVGQDSTLLDGLVFGFTGPTTGTNTYNINLSRATTATVSNAKDKDGVAIAGTFTMDYEQNSGSAVLVGKAGTLLEDMELIYTGSLASTNTYNIDINQGIGDFVYNQFYSLASQRVYKANDEVNTDDEHALDSLIDLEIVNLTDSSDVLQLNIDRIDSQIETYREQLLKRFSALEAAISSANSVLQLLDAQANAANKQ